MNLMLKLRDSYKRKLPRTLIERKFICMSILCGFNLETPPNARPGHGYLQGYVVRKKCAHLATGILLYYIPQAYF